MSAVFAATGDILGDRYMLRQSVWTSALGPVWVARDRVLDRSVLVQLLSPKLAADRTARRAFQKAAARVAQVTHSGLLAVYDIGDDPSFVVFEHAAGGRLAERLSAGPLRTTEAARAALGLARALEALHEKGAWHGSLSPKCVLFDEEGRAKLLADGSADVARAVGATELTEQPPRYRPPEREPLPADADRYALAALTVHMLTGAPPVPGTTARQQRRSVPADVDEMLTRALSSDPARRPSLDEFEGVLGSYARVVPRDARRPRMRVRELGWTVPVIVIIVLAGLVVTFGVKVARDLARKTEPKPHTKVTVNPTPGTPIEISKAKDFDPEGNRSEHPEDVGLAIDGDPGTAWETVGYRDVELGGKSGVGLLLDLGASKKIARVRVQSTLPGWQAEIAVADTASDKVTDYSVATTFTAGRDTLVPLPAATKGQFVLIWITKLVDDGGGSPFPFRAAIAELNVFGS